jgi:secondary thiamine-phosphate synthase enzyme
MTVRHIELQLDTRGHGHVVDLTDEAAAWIGRIGATEGLLNAFVPGSTGAITTIEFEPGCVGDLDDALERIAPSDQPYLHDQRWGDGNGFSHLRAALLGPSVTVPVAAGRCVLGTWQQLVLVDCDLHPRQRRVVLTFVGECVVED